jgi:multiple antibiotic resistance protein
MVEWTEYVKIFTALLAIVNPLGIIPIFVSLTGDLTKLESDRIARTASMTVAVVLISSALIGKLVLNFFGISIGSFKVGGGILLMLISVAMMQARHNQSRQTSEEAQEAEDKESIAVVPIATPLLAGPGAISTVIIFAQEPFHPLHISLIIISSLIVALISWMALSVANPISRMMSKTTINIITRLMGLLLAAIAVEFIVGGLSQLLPALTR